MVPGEGEERRSSQTGSSCGCARHTGACLPYGTVDTQLKVQRYGAHSAGKQSSKQASSLSGRSPVRPRIRIRRLDHRHSIFTRCHLQIACVEKCLYAAKGQQQKRPICTSSWPLGPLFAIFTRCVEKQQPQQKRSIPAHPPVCLPAFVLGSCNATA